MKIFRHLELEVALAITASNEWKITANNSTAHVYSTTVTSIRTVTAHVFNLIFTTSTFTFCNSNPNDNVSYCFL